MMIALTKHDEEKTMLTTVVVIVNQMASMMRMNGMMTLL